jgi:hypothetical protein
MAIETSGHCRKCGESDIARRNGRCMNVPGSEHDWGEPFKLQGGDRTRDPCPECGEELYDKYYGNAGWMPTEKSTGRTHHTDDCVRRLYKELKAKLSGIPVEEVLVWMAAAREAEGIRTAPIGDDVDYTEHSRRFAEAQDKADAALNTLVRKVIERA